MRRDGSSTGSDAVRRDVWQTVAAVFLRPSRLKHLVFMGPAGWWWTALYLARILPRASARLHAIRQRALRIPDAALRRQALDSIDLKAYHVAGGCVLATFLPQPEGRRFVNIITPLETIYDYLDNVCDRLDGVPAAAYPVLHEALLDAVDPARPLQDYYRCGPPGDDGGYLRSLVEEVRAGIEMVPRFGRVAPYVREAVAFYCDLQHLKHLPSPQREQRCEEWHAHNTQRFGDLSWWEFAAACGSSLPVFAMLYVALASDASVIEAPATYEAYFPSVSAVHILLDYFIDQAEDREHAELNFIACYPSPPVAVLRLRTLVRRAVERLRLLKGGARHVFVLEAMCTFYLTHRKVFEQQLDAQSRAVLAALR